MTDRGAVQRTAHIAPPGARKARCGRTVTPYSRVHHSWPICKSCVRAMKKFPSWTLTTVFDQDGWSLPSVPLATTSSSSNYTIKWSEPDAA